MSFLQVVVLWHMCVLVQPVCSSVVGANKSRKQKKKIRQGFCVERDDNVTNDSVTTATAR
jgi:hypothetical protein